MTALLRLAAVVARILAFIGAAGVVAMMIHISLDVALRNLFRVSIPVTTEMVARYYMVATAFLPLSWLELRREMVSVELFDFALTRPLRRISDAMVCLLSAIVYSSLAWTTWHTALSNFRSGTYVELAAMKMPVWHSYFLPPLGFAIAALTCLLLTFRDLQPTAPEETA
ncbi:TRAP transporter small permease [Martelella soudanensis]|uniref:TRAP transporter small permease n=1 Tax=unclassified Martelella TaxID=2629616 RepID=UPI0015DF1E58|nr:MULTISPECIES: TRAP transporter small permease [unclassified Martelella]